MSENVNERLEQLESYAMILRGLISYHKRMMCMAASPCQYSEAGEWKTCERAKANNGECPKATVMNDWYLGALEESLRLINDEIAALKRI
jgi:hypothetical protein